MPMHALLLLTETISFVFLCGEFEEVRLLTSNFLHVPPQPVRSGISLLP